MQRAVPYGGPLLGALLRMAHREVIAHVDQGFVENGYVPVQPAVTQALYDHPDGLRLTHLAALADVSKQAMAEMVDAMVAVGYVEQRPDPRDGRARLLRLTSKGKRVSEFARQRVLEVETRWERQHGRDRIGALRETLRTIVDAAATVRVEHDRELAAPTAHRAARRVKSGR